MLPFRQLVPCALLGVGLVLGLAPRADAGSIAISAIKPDLRVVAVGPTPNTSNYVRVVVTNNSPASAGSCYVRIDMSVVGGFFSARYLPPIAAYSSVVVDLWSYYPPAKPGMVTRATIDEGNLVKESNEFNNIAYYVAPAG